jgi:ABC-type ATPase with predicted acetyltransferase domain
MEDYHYASDSAINALIKCKNWQKGGGCLLYKFNGTKKPKQTLGF